MPELRFFDDSPNAGDPACLCSRCGELITEAQAPVIRMFVNDLEARFHRHCWADADGIPSSEPDWNDADDLGPYCQLCGCELEREVCGLCYGTGYRDDEDLMEEDPLWYMPGDTEPCGECGGKGGWWYCPNSSAHPEETEGRQQAEP